MGADLGSSAGADSSAISVSGLAEFSEGIFELLADLARNASFPEEEFERERRQKIEGLRIERTTPGFLASERFRRVLFGEHPYAVVAPTEEQVPPIARAELAGVLSQQLCRRRTRCCIVVGDFSSGRHVRADRKSIRQLASSRPGR